MVPAFHTTVIEVELIVMDLLYGVMRACLAAHRWVLFGLTVFKRNCRTAYVGLKAAARLP